MLKWILGLCSFRQSRRNDRRPLFLRPTLETLENRTVPATGFLQTNLISDLPGVAQLTDPNLKNPWGVAINPAGDFWVSDAANGTVTLYKGDVIAKIDGAAPGPRRERARVQHDPGRAHSAAAARKIGGREPGPRAHGRTRRVWWTPAHSRSGIAVRRSFRDRGDHADDRLGN